MTRVNQVRDGGLEPRGVCVCVCVCVCVLREEEYVIITHKVVEM